MSEKKWRITDSRGMYTYLYYDQRVRETSKPAEADMSVSLTLKAYKELNRIFPEEPNRFRIERVT